MSPKKRASERSRKLSAFYDAIQSLKLYRRAELLDSDNNKSIVEELYVDPLPQEQVFRTILKPNTTVLIGRKGTGKSTIFQRLQHELLKDKTRTSAYIDIKTVYESSQVDRQILEKIEKLPEALSPVAIEKLLLHKAFLRAVLVELKNEIRKRVRSASFWSRAKAKFGGNMDELFEDIDALLNQAEANKFESILGVKHSEVQSRESRSDKVAGKYGIGGDLGVDLKATLSAARESEYEASRGAEVHFADLLMRVFDIKSLMVSLKGLLERLGIRHLYVLVDDFSELPEEAMRIVVDTLLAPLNNWSEEFVKFKIAAYPGRVYYGQIDRTKIDELYLDLYKLYGARDVATMEEKATDFTKRLVERRLEFFGAGAVSDFFEPSAADEIWRLLFFATSANPRILGYILHYLHESNLIYEGLIGAKAIREAAQRYYEEKIESYFGMSRFLHESFSERSSIFSLKELLEEIVKRARELRTHESSSLMRDIQGRPPTSHFHVIVDFEVLLQTLELNFFLTKYYEMVDRDGRKVSVFALSYGLCQKYTIEFGRPRGKREFRTYFIERVFDYTYLLQGYMEKNQEIVCDSCGAKYSLEVLPSLRLYNMKCPECAGVCSVVNLSKRYEPILRAVDQSLLLPRTELGILHALHSEGRALFANDIAYELDCSYQLVGKRGKILADRGLVDRKENEAGRRTFSLTDVAEKNYFPRQDEGELKIEEE